MVLVFPIGFMKLLLLLHQHVPFLSKKILHSVPFCRTSHVQFLLGSLALCVALSLTLAHVHFRTVIERMCLCPSYCWDCHSSLRPCYFCIFSSWSSGNNGYSEGVVVVLVEQDVNHQRLCFFCVEESGCCRIRLWLLKPPKPISFCGRKKSVCKFKVVACQKRLQEKYSVKNVNLHYVGILSNLFSLRWWYICTVEPTPTTTQMFQRERQKFVLAFLFWRTTPAFNLAILLCCCFFPCSCPRGDNWSSPENHGFLFGIKKKPGMRKPKRHTLVVVMQDGGTHNKSCGRPSVCDW